MVFEELLAQAKGGADLDALKVEFDAAMAEAGRLRVELDASMAKAADLAERFAAPVRQAIAAASLLNVAVPVEFLTADEHNAKPVPKGNGGYEWSTTGETPKRESISLAAWNHTKGTCLGKKSKRMGADELVAHIKAETGTDIRTMPLGASVSFTLKDKSWSVHKVSE